MPLPLILGGLARLGVGSIAKKIAGKALRFVTKGRLIGAGGGAAAARRIGGAVVGATTAVEVYRGARRTIGRGTEPTMPVGTAAERRAWETEVYGAPRGSRYRRMNPMNVRALRRSVRRINSAEKLFRKVFTITKGQVNVRKARRSS